MQIYAYCHPCRQISICHALSYNSAGLKEALIEYDIACQWSLHFAERVKASQSLSLPPDLSWIAAVGKFHLAAHIVECFHKFSLNFVPGAGQQAYPLQSVQSVL